MEMCVHGLKGPTLFTARIYICVTEHTGHLHELTAHSARAEIS